MATGMEFMLKSFGLDPEIIKKNVGEFGQIIVQIRDTLVRIEARQVALETRFDTLNTQLSGDPPSTQEQSNVAENGTNRTGGGTPEC